MLGPSGSGKTTLLYAVAGFVDLAAGDISIGGRTVATVDGGQPPELRDVGFVFQHYALWPHLDALATVAYPLRRRGLDRIGGRGASPGSARSHGHRRPGPSEACRALRWSTTTGRLGPGAGRTSGSLSVRRTDCPPRHVSTCRSAGATGRAKEGFRGCGRVRHPRLGRSAGHSRSDCSAARRFRGPDRRSRGGVQQAGGSMGRPADRAGIGDQRRRCPVGPPGDCHSL